MALASQLKAVAAQKAGFFDREIVPVTIPQKKGEPVVVDRDEHPRETSLEALAKLKGVVRPDGTVTAGNASGVNDGACALILASEAAAARHGLTPRARVVGMAVAGVPPRIMGIGPAPATRKVPGPRYKAAPVGPARRGPAYRGRHGRACVPGRGDAPPGQQRGAQTRSRITAMPWPTPMHMVHSA
jgi:hypothetical protein